MARKRNTRTWVALALATSVAAVAYKIYQEWLPNEDEQRESSNVKKIKSKYANKSVTLTLLHSVLNSDSSLEEILLNSNNVTFILPPYLSVDDLQCNISGKRSMVVPEILQDNYKLLKCSNMQGYFQLLKNLRPDILIVCTDDLGITEQIPKDLGRFVGKVVTIDQEKDKARTVLSEYF